MMTYFPFVVSQFIASCPSDTAVGGTSAINCETTNGWTDFFAKKYNCVHIY